MEENTIVQENDVDSVLNSVGDEYLAKKKRNRKIIFSVISFLTLALATIIIVMSCIKVNLKPSFISDASSYRITINNSDKMLLDKSSEEFEEFNKIFEESFSMNYLSALFAGKLGGYEIKSDDETTDYFYSNTTNNTGMSTTLKNALGSNYVRVKFAEDKVVKYSNGETYKSKYNSDNELVFNELFFNLSTSEEDEKITFYLGTTGYLSGTRITKITIKANTYALYEYATQD